MSENKGGRKEGLASLLGRMVMAMMAMSASTDDQQQWLLLWLWIVGNVMSWGLACVLLAVIAAVCLGSSSFEEFFSVRS